MDSRPPTTSPTDDVVTEGLDGVQDALVILRPQPWFNNATTAASLDAVWNQYWGYISAAGTAPIWLGEFGTDNTATDIQNTAAGSQGQWFQSLVAYLQGNPAMSWTYWALNGEDSYDLLDSSYDLTPPSSAKQTLLQSIQFSQSASRILTRRIENERRYR
jgi:aryl-phospho-beta-D-glucosidase BglC (GH1 family)